MYEHKFIKIKLSSFNRASENDYHTVIYEQEKKGWELVQIFAPGVKQYGMPSFFELILKRRLS